MREGGGATEKGETERQSNPSAVRAQQLTRREEEKHHKETK